MTFPDSRTLSRHLPFALLCTALWLVGLLVRENHFLAAWYGFAIVAFAGIQNDSLQTLAPWLAANLKAKWWIPFLIFGGILVGT